MDNLFCMVSSQSRWNPKYYNQNSKTQQLHALDVLKCYEFKGNESVLDIGSGDGKITAEIAKHLDQGEIIGIDNDPSMVAFAKNEFNQEKFSNLRFEIADAIDFSFTKPFDLIISFSCLHWVKEQAQALATIRNNISLGGHMVLMLYPKDFFWDILEETVQDPEWAEFFIGYENPYHVFSPEEYTALLEQANFLPLRVEEKRKTTLFEAKAKMYDFLRTWMPQLQKLPDFLKSSFLTDFVERYTQHVQVDDDGTIHMPFSRLEVEAKPN